MAQVTLSDRAIKDLERLAAFFEGDPELGTIAYERIIEGIFMLEEHPLLGRRKGLRFRELVISRGKTGYLVLYEVIESRDLVRIHAVRHQREVWGDHEP